MPLSDYFRLQWPTREPRPVIWSDHRKTVAQLLKELQQKEKEKWTNKAE